MHNSNLTFTDIISNFAETLDELLNEYKLTAKQFALEIGAQVSSVSLYLRAMSIPTINRLVKIADYFNCSTDYLLGLEEEKHSGIYSACPPFNKQLDFLKQYYKCTNSFLYTNSEIPKSRYYDWLKGKKVPTLENALKLAKLLNCSFDFVIGRNKLYK